MLGQMQKVEQNKNRTKMQYSFQNINVSSAGLFYGGIGICMYLSKTNSNLATSILKEILKNFQNHRKYIQI